MQQKISFTLGYTHYEFNKGDIEIPRVGEQIMHRGNYYTVYEVVHEFDIVSSIQYIYVRTK